MCSIRDIFDDILRSFFSFHGKKIKEKDIKAKLLILLDPSCRKDDVFVTVCCTIRRIGKYTLKNFYMSATFKSDLGMHFNPDTYDDATKSGSFHWTLAMKL